MTMVAVVLTFWLAAPASALDVPRVGPSGPVGGPQVTGAAPADYPRLQPSLDETWVFVRRLAGADDSLPPPRLHFAPFEPAAQDAEWTRWQSAWSAGRDDIFASWLCSSVGRKKFPDARPLCSQGEAALRAFVAAHPEVRREYPFPPEFRAFHYDGTGVIQINPATTYLPYFQTMPDGTRRDLVGYGPYVAGHEMLHYALVSRGVPGPTHHCLFITKRPDTGTSPMEDLAAFLQERGYAGFAVRRYGLQQEEMLDPCKTAGKP